MRFTSLKYLLVFTTPIVVLFSLSMNGLWTYFALIFVFVVIPLLEFLFTGNEHNMTKLEEAIALEDKTYDYIIWSLVPMQLLTLVYFLVRVSDPSVLYYEKVGMMTAFGISCGVLGINAAHELGHRLTKHEHFMSKILLATTLYMHFFTEHNKGHHKNVATPQDPSSARYNEPVYLFYFRTVVLSYFSAWHIANDEVKKKGLPVLHWKNEMIQFHVIEIIFVGLIAYLFGWMITLYFIIAATIGFLLLETVNYIEHYGLQRKETGEGKYERAMPEHSWNSDHTLGRLMLFELSRHSDHHYLASRKYQLLRHHDDAPQMPTGYPGMMLLSLVPPLWFYVMNKKIKGWNELRKMAA